MEAGIRTGGTAQESLLDTYTTERKAVAVSNGDWSVGNAPRFATAGRGSSSPEIASAVMSGNTDRIAFWLDDWENHTHNVGRSLGFTYTDGALLPDGTTLEEPSSRYYNASDRPGERFPHVWLDTSRRRSTLDWFDTTFTLVSGPDGTWADAAKHASARLGVQLPVQTLPSTELPSGIRMGPRGAALIRPDGHVAWRVGWIPDLPAAELTDALHAVLTSGVNAS